jgi:hypothetical protein
MPIKSGFIRRHVSQQRIKYSLQGLTRPWVTYLIDVFGRFHI